MGKDSYYELVITLNTKENFVDFLADFIANISNGVEISDNKIVVRSEKDISNIKNAIDTLIKSLGVKIDIDYKIEKKRNIDWIENYKSSIKPIEVGRFYIYPSWHEPKRGKINIKLDPALAFGSGHHATTRLCLRAIERYVQDGNTLLDIGCGSGILGLASRKLGAIVDLCDTDPVAVESCKKNFMLNQEEYNALWEGSVNMTQKRYDIIIANIIADVLKFIANDINRTLKSGSILILSGILDKKEDIVRDSYSNLKLLERNQEDEWVTLVYQKN
jgi:ribosomal protein L11 methyltransferase